MAVLVDSSTFVRAERLHLSPAEVGALSSGDRMAIAAITASELLVGVYRSRHLAYRVQRERFVRWILESFPSLPFDLTVAEVYAQLWANLAESGSLIAAHDLIIAATAVAHGYSVLTENVAHFRTVPGLDVRQPRWTP